MRHAAAELCDAVTRAEAACFADWCRLLDRRTAASPEAVTASQAALHEAAGRLRELCLADPAAAESERQELMARQAEVEDALRQQRGGDGTRSHSDWASARWSIISRRNALTCGLGWPHRGEPVTVSTWRHAADGTRIPVTGDGIYLNSCDVFNVTHEAWVPALGARHRDGSVGLRWGIAGSERGPLGPADPAGDIGLRLRDNPGRALPVPLMRWPGRYAAAPQAAPPDLALFAVTEITAPPGRQGLAARPPRGEPKPPARPAAELTLF